MFNELATEGICNEAQWIALIKKHQEMLLKKITKFCRRQKNIAKLFMKMLTNGLKVQMDFQLATFGNITS